MTGLADDTVKIGDDAIITTADPEVTGYAGAYQDMLMPHIGQTGRISGIRKDDSARWLWISATNKNAQFWLPGAALCAVGMQRMDLQRAKDIVRSEGLTCKGASEAIEWLIHQAERVQAFDENVMRMKGY